MSLFVLSFVSLSLTDTSHSNINGTPNYIQSLHKFLKILKLMFIISLEVFLLFLKGKPNHTTRLSALFEY